VAMYRDGRRERQSWPVLFRYERLAPDTVHLTRRT
jgi:hypothetical protein